MIKSSSSPAGSSAVLEKIVFCALRHYWLRFPRAMFYVESVLEIKKTVPSICTAIQYILKFYEMVKTSRVD